MKPNEARELIISDILEILDIECYVCGTGTAKKIADKMLENPEISHLFEAEEWISVEDRLPEALNGVGDYKAMTGEVLCYCEEYGVVKSYYAHDDRVGSIGWHATDSDYETGEPWLSDKKVTHWQPLPTPPVTEGNDEGGESV